MGNILYFPGNTPVCTYAVFRRHAAKLLGEYPVDEETVKTIYELLRGDDAYHALKLLRLYMSMDEAREMTIELNACMEGRI